MVSRAEWSAAKAKAEKLIKPNGAMPKGEEKLNLGPALEELANKGAPDLEKKTTALQKALDEFNKEVEAFLKDVEKVSTAATKYKTLISSANFDLDAQADKAKIAAARKVLLDELQDIEKIVKEYKKQKKVQLTGA